MGKALSGVLLRVFANTLDKYRGKPLYEVIVEKARKRGLAGTTVLRGIMGYGASGQVHAPKILGLSENLPVVIEIVDKPERIDAFLPALEELVTEGLVTVQRVSTSAHRHKSTTCTGKHPR